MHRVGIGEVVGIYNIELYSWILSSCLGKSNHRIGIDKNTSLNKFKTVQKCLHYSHKIITIRYIQTI